MAVIVTTPFSALPDTFHDTSPQPGRSILSDPVTVFPCWPSDHVPPVSGSVQIPETSEQFVAEAVHERVGCDMGAGRTGRGGLGGLAPIRS